MCEPGGVASSLLTREKFDIASELLNELIDGSRDGYDAVAAQYGVERSHALRADLVGIAQLVGRNVLWRKRWTRRNPKQHQQQAIVEFLLASTEFGGSIDPRMAAAALETLCIKRTTTSRTSLRPLS